MGEKRGVYRDYVWEPEGKRPLGTPIYIYIYIYIPEGNIKMNLQEVEWGGMHLIAVAQDGEDGGLL